LELNIRLTQLIGDDRQVTQVEKFKHKEEVESGTSDPTLT
jgi:hypothetical protein